MANDLGYDRCMAVPVQAKRQGGLAEWHQRVFQNSELTLCGLLLNAESIAADEAPPSPWARCLECELVLEEIERVVRAASEL